MRPLKQASLRPVSDRWVAEIMSRRGISEEEARQLAQEEAAGTTYWINDIYQVQMRVIENNLVHLNIRRRDGKPILRDWRHFQMIKDQLVGPECEGVELYPAQSRLVDTSNKYHLWCVKDPSYRFPIGFDERDVSDGVAGTKTSGFKQRPLPEEWR